MAGPINASGLIPTAQSSQLIEAATAKSAVLTLGRRVPMPAGITQIPVLSALPTASFLAAVGDRKPYTDLGITNEILTAEEIGAVVAVPQAYLDDSGVDLWAAIQPQLAEAIGRGVDNAALWGVGAPPSFPTGGVGATAPNVATGIDVADQINTAMGHVEGSGLPVTGHAADLVVKAALRGVRDANGALLLGPSQLAGQPDSAIYGTPVVWTVFPESEPDLITGDWDCLIVGVRQDIRYELSEDGVIADAAGKVLISAFQDDQVLMRVYMRLGVVLVKPRTSDGTPGGSQPSVPFATVTLPAAAAAKAATSRSSK